MSYNVEDIYIPTFVINRKDRTDRLEHILNQFAGKPEFDLKIVEACEHTIGAVGLWHSIRKIIKQAVEDDEDVVIICEDDHIFTENYNKEYLLNNILEACEQGVELLSGGIGGFDSAVPITKNRYWIDWLWCAQFTVFYKPIFQKILDVEFKDNDTADGIYSVITTKKMVLYPFISIQKDFGYSDVTAKNDRIKGMITQYFQEADRKLKIYQNVYEKYLIPQSSTPS